MSKILVLAEKPSVGRDLARVLKCNSNKRSYIEGNKYIVTWALGHLVTLASPESYDDKYKSWNMENLPMLPNKMKLEVIKKSSKQFYEIKKLLGRNDIESIVIATDAGREGELVARWILDKCHYRGSLSRLWISSQTDKAILDGFKNLKNGKEYENLYKAATARAEADWVVGLNVTRALTCRYNASLSAGRVQTPTLAMIVNRENEIKHFKPKAYYTINGKCNGFNLTHVDNKNNSRIFDVKVAESIVAKTNKEEGTVVEVKESAKKNYAPMLYDLTELQRDCNKIFGYSAKQTLSIMQRLYENHKILTYPRTDSRHITTDIVPTLKDRLKSISFGNYRMFCDDIIRKGIKANKSFVDNNRVSDHHAIIPTEERVIISHLSSEERNVYDLVIKRFLSVMLPPFEYIQTTVDVNVKGERFLAKGKVVQSKGWKAVYDREMDDDKEDIDDLREQMLPKFEKGEKVKILSVDMKKGETKPPARFNEGTLLSAMENPQKYVHVDKNAAKTLGETGGIGTVATRADIIEKLYNMFYIEKKGKDIIPTSKGIQLIDLVPEDLKSPLLTAQWESDLELISKGKANDKKFITSMRDYATKLVGDVKSSSDKFVHDNVTGSKCPKCGKYMLEVKTKTGVMNVCQDRECGHRESISRTTNARCPECKKKLILKGHGEGQIYVCSGANCNFREKASSFNKRFDKKSDKVNKRDVNNYMKKMKKEADAPINDAFAGLMDLFKESNK
ncbi:DNA topoisomerase III [Clostridium sp. CTA-19]